MFLYLDVPCDLALFCASLREAGAPGCRNPGLHWLGPTKTVAKPTNCIAKVFPSRTASAT